MVLKKSNKKSDGLFGLKLFKYGLKSLNRKDLSSLKTLFRPLFVLLYR